MDPSRLEWFVTRGPHVPKTARYLRIPLVWAFDRVRFQTGPRDFAEQRAKGLVYCKASSRKEQCHEKGPLMLSYCERSQLYLETGHVTYFKLSIPVEGRSFGRPRFAL